jgi:hypothetical protein
MRVMQRQELIQLIRPLITAQEGEDITRGDRSVWRGRDVRDDTGPPSDCLLMAISVFRD